ncbi:MAG: DUF4245 domain-containing protein [Dactylosporangium sp.]|nr:DUF4245 domain-containing protein [Dactylosporangium sp.]NNJ61946.1 DUF4245 domain-containing protein [Dactylosporangium sp.]
MPQATADRPNRPFRGVVTGAVVLLIIAFVLVGVARVFGREARQPVSADTAAAYGAAAAAQAFPVASPTRLPDGWRALNSDFHTGEPAPMLRVGLRAPDGGAVQLIQSAWPPESLLPAELGAAARPKGDVLVAGRTWQRYLAERGMRALVLLDPDRTIILVGTASDKDLRGLAGSLLPVG